jgi:hypothetical protein
MYIGVALCIHMGMMLMMFLTQNRVVVKSKKDSTKPTNRIIDIGIFNADYPMNRIVGRDEQTGI